MSAALDHLQPFAEDFFHIMPVPSAHVIPTRKCGMGLHVKRAIILDGAKNENLVFLEGKGGRKGTEGAGRVSGDGIEAEISAVQRVDSDEGREFLLTVGPKREVFDFVHNPLLTLGRVGIPVVSTDPRGDDYGLVKPENPIEERKQPVVAESLDLCRADRGEPHEHREKLTHKNTCPVEFGEFCYPVGQMIDGNFDPVDLRSVTVRAFDDESLDVLQVLANCLRFAGGELFLVQIARGVGGVECAERRGLPEIRCSEFALNRGQPNLKCIHQVEPVGDLKKLPGCQWRKDVDEIPGGFSEVEMIGVFAAANFELTPPGRRSDAWASRLGAPDEIFMIEAECSDCPEEIVFLDSGELEHGHPPGVTAFCTVDLAKTSTLKAA